ncbi:helix-turn-helix domain-containing protein, partial [Glaesserella parasuis]
STLGERIEQAMNLKGLKRKELAEVLNISTMAVGDLINNKTKKPRYLVEIAEALGVDVKWLQTGEGEMRSHVDDVDVIDKDKDYSDTHISIDMYDIKL